MNAEIERLEAKAEACYTDMRAAQDALRNAYDTVETSRPSLSELGFAPSDLGAVRIDPMYRMSWFGLVTASIPRPSTAEEDGEYHAEALADYIEAAWASLGVMSALISYLDGARAAGEDGEGEE